MNHATVPYATITDPTTPMASTIQPCASIPATPIGFAFFPTRDLSKSYAVATIIVGIDRKKENSNADARDIPANCPAAMVDMDREVPGKTADRIWHAPIHTACPKLMSSICHVRISSAFEPSPAVSALLLRES